MRILETIDFHGKFRGPFAQSTTLATHQVFPDVDRRIECDLLHTLEIGPHTQFIGEIKDVKADESIITGDLPDIKKAKPILYAPDTREYYGIGEFLAKAFSVGKEIEQ